MMTDDLLATQPDVPPVTSAEMTYSRTTTRIQVATAVWSLWARLRHERGVDQQWLADRLGKDKSRISRLLKGPGNWTLDTVADLLGAMDGRLTLVEAHSYDEIARGVAARARQAGARTRVYVRTTEILIEESDSDLADKHRELDHIVPAAGTLIPVLNRTVVERSWDSE